MVDSDQAMRVCRHHAGIQSLYSVYHFGDVSHETSLDLAPWGFAVYEKSSLVTLKLIPASILRYAIPRHSTPVCFVLNVFPLHFVLGQIA